MPRETTRCMTNDAILKETPREQHSGSIREPLPEEVISFFYFFSLNLRSGMKEQFGMRVSDRTKLTNAEIAARSGQKHGPAEASRAARWGSTNLKADLLIQGWQHLLQTCSALRRRKLQCFLKNNDTESHHKQQPCVSHSKNDWSILQKKMVKLNQFSQEKLFPRDLPLCISSL